MDQLTRNLEKLSRNVDLRIEHLLIERTNGLSDPIPESAFSRPAFLLHAGEESLVVSSGSVGAPMWVRPTALSETAAGRSLEARLTEARSQVPAVVQRSSIRRIMSWFGLR